MSEDLKYSASVMCADLLHLEDDIKELKAAECNELHFDIMDGVFVPNLTLGFDFIKAAKSCCDIPLNAHLMVVRPEPYIERFVEAGCSSISVHVETCPHAHRTLQQIRDAGASPGIAINPATPLTELDYLLDFADRVMMMTVDPGYAGQKIIPAAFERVRILSENIKARGLNTEIEVDGNINVENAATLARMGATIFVCGTSSIFHGTKGPKANLEEFREKVVEQMALV